MTRIIFAALTWLALCCGAAAQCNPPSGFIAQNGPATLGNLAVWGPGCGQQKDGGVPAVQPFGGVGQCLTGTGAFPSLPIFNSGCRTLLNTLVANNSAALTDTTSFSTNYNEYEIILENIVSANNAVICELQPSIAGSGFQFSNYVSAATGQSGGAAFTNTTTGYIPCGSASASQSNAQPGTSCRIMMLNQNGSGVFRHFVGTCSVQTASGAGVANYLTATVSGYNTVSNNIVNGIQVVMSAGNITSGTMKIYGLL